MNRDYYYEVNERGILSLDGVVQNDPAFIDFFFRRLAITANPHYPDHPFVSRCGDEMNYLRPADTPIVFTRFDGERLIYAHSLSVPMYPDRLTYSDKGVLYHWAPVGGVGRIVPHIATELSKNIEHWGPYYAYRDGNTGRLTPILPVEFDSRFKVLRPRPDNACIGCGANNPFSLYLTFLYNIENAMAITYVVPDIRMQGSLGITHGGVISLLFDETMGKCLSARGIKAPTAKLTVNFRKPMVLGIEYQVRGWVDHQHGKKNVLHGEIREWKNSDAIIAEAEGLFVTVKQDISE